MTVTLTPNPVEEFLAHQEHYNGVGRKRVNAVRRYLHSFREHAGCDPHLATPQQFEAWMSWRLQSVKASCVRHEATGVRSYIRWCWHRDVIDSDRYMRMLDVKPPPSARLQPRPYDRRELLAWEQDLVATYPPAKPLIWKRWRNGTSPWRKVWRHCMQIQLRAEVALALDCGLRNVEIHQISIEDMHPDNDFVVVRKGKFGLYREVPQTDATREDVHAWLELRAELNPPHDSPWMILNPQASAKRFASWPDAPGTRSWGRRLSLVGRGWELHRFRHTCATEWLRAGMELEHVSRLLGHADLQTTLRYAKLVKSDVHRSAERVSAQFTQAVRPHRQSQATSEREPWQQAT
jgi:site-specific recombinase XerD